MYTEPKLPTLAKDANDTAPVLEAYEQANKKNKFAIEQAQKHNRKLQRMYNKKPIHQEEPKSFFSFLKF